MLLNRLAGREGRLAANLFGSRDLMARGIGATPDTFLTVLGDALDHLIPAEVLPDGTPTGAGTRGCLARRGRRPQPPAHPPALRAGRRPVHHCGHDRSRAIRTRAWATWRTSGCRSPGPQRLGASLHSRQHTWDYLRRAEKRGQDLPVAIVIGAHPAVMLAGAAKMGIGEDEYDLAGALIGQPLQLVRGCTVDVMVPATAEIVIEGKLLANVHETEGPFGEYTGYVTGRSTHNVIEVSAITMRRDAIFVDVIPGNSAEHLILGRAAKEAWVHKRMREALPFFVDFHYPSSGTHFHCFVRIDKSAEGQAQQAAQLLVGLDHYVKLVVVVDSDVDPSDEAAVMWAMATRMQADRDADDPDALHVQQARPVER